MILGTGVDLIEIGRIEKVFDTEKKKMRIFTEKEIALASPANYARLSGYYAAKEAFSKALGTGIKGIAFKDIEVLKDKAGKPYINKEKILVHVQRQFNVEEFTVHLTISHDRDKAIAMVIIEEDTMRIADIEMMRGMDQEANLTFGIPSIILMENAAIGVLKNLDLLKTSYVIVAGPGNNGGDGFALARHLHGLGKNVTVFILSKDGLIKGDAKVNYDILLKLKISVEIVSNEKHLLSLKEAVKDADVTIDALLGTGAKGPLSDLFMKVIEIMNDYSEMIISIDVPSGLDADTGLAMPVAVRATKTISFQCIKKGYLNEKALDFVGELIVEDIGIPELAMKLVDKEVYMTEALDMERILPLREKSGYKSRYGRVLVVAGSRGLTGAAKISSEAAIATGSGLVTLSSHEDIMNDLVPTLREIMSLYPQDLEEGVRKSDVVAFGPGLGNTEETLALLLRVIKTMQEEGMKSSTLVIDADGLNVIEGKCEILKSLNFNVILTPHPGEMARLTGLSVKEITSNRIEIAREFAKTYGVVLVLKGYHTVITDGKVAYVNPTGSSAMAQGGMGDALTGIIASLAGQGIKPMDAAIFGVYLHGSIGDSLSRERYSVKASEIIEKIPYHMKQILDGKINRRKAR